MKPLGVSTVSGGMTCCPVKTETFDPRGGYAVRRPRASDAVGRALRGAFGKDDTLPSDIVRALNRLDRLTG